MMRGKWQLNSLLGDHNRKERNDHRHHIVDAFVVGLTDRGVLNQVSRNSARGAGDRVHIEVPDIRPLRDQLSDRLDTIIVSYKPDHGVNGKMFNETAYGLISDEKQDPDLPGYGLVTRKKIDSLSLKEISAIRNAGWRTRVQAHVELAGRAAGKTLNKNALAKSLAEFGKENNIKTMRILVSNQSAISIQSAPWKAYAPGSFACVDIWQVPKGKPGKWKVGEYEWHGAFWSYAECKGEIPNKNNGMIKGAPIHPAAKHISRLFKNDLVELVEGGTSKIMKVGGFSTTNNKIDLRPQYETDGEQKYFSVNILHKTFRKKLRVSEDGRSRG
jgi:CRISPR-associated endonuclease Csn1